MIRVNKDGRHRSERTEEELLKIIREEMRLMTKEERKALAVTSFLP